MSDRKETGVCYIVFTYDQIQYIREELEPIRDKLGAFSLDHEKHAWNVMEASTEHANNILKLLNEVVTVQLSPLPPNSGE